MRSINLLSRANMIVSIRLIKAAIEMIVCSTIKYIDRWYETEYHSLKQYIN